VQLHNYLLQAANQLQESEIFFPSFLPLARLIKVNKYGTREACDLLTQWQGNNRQDRLSLTAGGKRLYSAFLTGLAASSAALLISQVFFHDSPRTSDICTCSAFL
jgi:hypothetical protein